MYLYAHNDGRTGKAHSGWTAIQVALGSKEALALPNMRENFWRDFAPKNCHGETAFSKSDCETEAGEIIGTLYKIS